MQNNKNNISFNVRNITLNYKTLIFSLQNIISFFRNLNTHLTDKQKIATSSHKILTLRFKNITLCSLILTLSSINIINTFTYIPNVSALDYSSNVGVGFTFNPALSISLSSNDLVIPNLVPGRTLDSNSINVSVATNAAYGYTLSATAGDILHNDTNLTHTNNTNIFSSIATNADLASLDTDNTWGYTSKLSNETAWGNYNGLSSSSNTILLDTSTNSIGSNSSSSNINSNYSDSNNSSNNIDSVDFKIAAKASNTQPSGEYTNTINFIAVSKVAPMSLLDSFIASGAEQLNGYFKMQDMTHDICEAVDVEESELQLIDVRDNKVYWVAKLKDGNCWMTQNLDLDLDSNRTYTHWDTDLGWSTEDGSTVDENATWRPTHSTIDFDGANTNQVPGWVNSNTEPYSANPGDIYYYTSNSDADDIKYNSLQECITAGHNDCAHYHTGNYYNWSVVVASNDASEVTSGSAQDSVCPKGWKSVVFNEYTKLFQFYNIISQSNNYTQNGFNALRTKPLYYVRSGRIRTNAKILSDLKAGYYWYGTIFAYLGLPYFMAFSSSQIYNNAYDQQSQGCSVRCTSR